MDFQLHDLAVPEDFEDHGLPVRYPGPGSFDAVRLLGPAVPVHFNNQIFQLQSAFLRDGVRGNMGDVFPGF